MAWEIYLKIRTQVRASYGGVIGLDYNVVFNMFDILGVDHDEREPLLERLRIIESVMLEHIEEQRKKEERKNKNRFTACTQKYIGSGSIDNIESRTITGNR